MGKLYLQNALEFYRTPPQCLHITNLIWMKYWGSKLTSSKSGLSGAQGSLSYFIWQALTSFRSEKKLLRCRRPPRECPSCFRTMPLALGLYSPSPCPCVLSSSSAEWQSCRGRGPGAIASGGGISPAFSSSSPLALQIGGPSLLQRWTWDKNFIGGGMGHLWMLYVRWSQWAHGWAIDSFLGKFLLRDCGAC